MANLQQKRPMVFLRREVQHQCRLLRFSVSIAQRRQASIAASGREGRMKRLDAAKLERLGRLVCGPLWQSELAGTMGVSRQTVLRWAAGSSSPRLNILPRPKSWSARGSGSCSAYSKCCEGGAAVRDRPPCYPTSLGGRTHMRVGAVAAAGKQGQTLTGHAHSATFAQGPPFRGCFSSPPEAAIAV